MREPTINRQDSMSCSSPWSRLETQENSGNYRIFCKRMTVLPGAFRRYINPRVVNPHAYRVGQVAHMNKVDQVEHNRER